MQAVVMMHDADPKQAIFDQLGRLTEDMAIGGHDVLLAGYKRSGMTAGGILLTDKTTDEDDFQGKVALVLKVGPLAFTGSAKGWFGDHPPQVGDWVVVNVNTTFPFKLGKRTLRLVEDQYIRLVVPEPDNVF